MTAYAQVDFFELLLSVLYYLEKETENFQMPDLEMCSRFRLKNALLKHFGLIYIIHFLFFYWVI